MSRAIILEATAIAALTLASASAGEDANRPEQKAQSPAADPFGWGEAVDGLQLGLVPTGRGDTPAVRNVFFEGEGLKFALYLRNAGETELTLLHASLLLPDFRILVTRKDGGKSLVARFDASGLPKDIASRVPPVRLVRGSHGNCLMEFDSNWSFEESAGGAQARKALPVGKYTLQVVYQPRLAEGEAGWQGKALTGCVDIEVRTKPAPTMGSPVGGGGGGGGGGGRLPPGRVTPL